MAKMITKGLAFASLSLFVSISQAGNAIGQQSIFCGSSAGLTNVHADLKFPGYQGIDWKENFADLDGVMKIKTSAGVEEVRVKGQFKLRANEPIEANFQIENPFLRKLDEMRQSSMTYTEIYVLKNRVHSKEENGFVRRAEDLTGFEIICLVSSK